MATFIFRAPHKAIISGSSPHTLSFYMRRIYTSSLSVLLPSINSQKYLGFVFMKSMHFYRYILLCNWVPCSCKEKALNKQLPFDLVSSNKRLYCLSTLKRSLSSLAYFLSLSLFSCLEIFLANNIYYLKVKVRVDMMLLEWVYAFEFGGYLAGGVFSATWTLGVWPELTFWFFPRHSNALVCFKFDDGSLEVTAWIYLGIGVFVARDIICVCAY